MGSLTWTKLDQDFFVNCLKNENRYSNQLKNCRLTRGRKLSIYKDITFFYGGSGPFTND